MLNQIQLIGNLGKDPELRYTPNGKPQAKFSVAVSRSWTTPEGERKEETTWFSCIAWERTAEYAMKYLAKGKKVFVQGRMTSHDWTDAQGVKKTFWDVIVNQIENLSPKANDDNDNGGGPAIDAGPPVKSAPLADEEFV
jgi:single-strand DNA-binding protein